MFQQLKSRTTCHPTHRPLNERNNWERWLIDYTPVRSKYISSRGRTTTGQVVMSFLEEQAKESVEERAERKERWVKQDEKKAERYALVEENRNTRQWALTARKGQNWDIWKNNRRYFRWEAYWQEGRLVSYCLIIALIALMALINVSYLSLKW